MANSLAFRKFREQLSIGSFPDKFVSVGKLVEGKTVLDVGGAEGGLAMFLASIGKRVTVLDKSIERIEAGRELWGKLRGDLEVSGSVSYQHGDIVEVAKESVSSFDSVVFMRSLYYLKSEVVPTLSRIKALTQQLVLVANGNRQKNFLSDPLYQAVGLGSYNYWSTTEGMILAAKLAGFRVVRVVDEPDPVVLAAQPSGSDYGRICI